MKTSHDGHSSCSSITDAATRHSWTFLKKIKEPPLITLNTFLSQHRLKKDETKCVWTNQGGEQARLTALRTLMAKHNHTVEPTGTDNSSQNWWDECPRGTFANMMECMLHSSDLGGKFWSNATPHSAHGN